MTTSFGQITGGVVDDFNNLLTMITGTIENLRESVADQPLLAASPAHRRDRRARRQPLQPGENDIDALVAETCKLLRSMLGEHIKIAAVLAADAWLVLALVDRGAALDPLSTDVIVPGAMNGRERRRPFWRGARA